VCEVRVHVKALSLSLSLIAALLLALTLTSGIVIITPVGNATYPAPEIVVSYLTNGTRCSAMTEPAGILLPENDIAACSNFSYVASQGRNSIILSDSRSAQSVDFWVGQRPEPPVPPPSSHAPASTSTSNASSSSPTVVENPVNGNAPASSPDAATPEPAVSDVSLAPYVTVDEPQDEQDPFSSLFGKRSVSNMGITADRLNYDYPAGVAFTAYVKVRNTGSTDSVTLVLTAFHAQVLDITRVEATASDDLVPYSIRQFSPTRSCVAGECLDEMVENIIGTRSKVVRRYTRLERSLERHSSIDPRVSRITDARHRTPPSAKGVSADDRIIQGTEAVYAVRLRASGLPSDEFFIQAVSETMAQGLDPFVNSNWSYARVLALNETYGYARANQLVYMNLTGFTASQLHNCTEEIRVSNASFDDIPVRVIDDGGNLSSSKYCVIEFGASLGAGAGVSFYLYFGNPDATAPAAATDNNLFFNLTWVRSAQYFPNTDIGTAANDYISPAVLDYNCDGTVDLVFGLANGTVRWLNNTNSNATPAWAASQQIIARLGATTYAAPEFALLYGSNAIKDLAIGLSNGTIAYFENTNTCVNPNWQRRTPANNGGYDFGTNTKPAGADFDGDGDTDFIVGISTGLFNSSQNTGGTASPGFTIATLPYPTMSLTSNAAPVEVDLNFDGAIDIIAGNNAGNVFIIYNNGTPTQPSFVTSTVQLLYESSSTVVDVGNNANPAEADLNFDGWPDIILGDRVGYITAGTAAADRGDYLINAPLNASNSSTNGRPTVRSVRITPAAPYKNDTLNCSANVTDAESSSITVNFTWSKDGAIEDLLNGSTSCTNSSWCYNPRAVAPGNLSAGENWTCIATAYDLLWLSSASNSTSILYTFDDTMNLTTDAETYYQGDIVVVDGAGFLSSATINLTFNYTGGTWSTLLAANSSGAFTYEWPLLYSAQTGLYNLTAFDIANLTYTKRMNFTVLQRIPQLTTNMSSYTTNQSVGINGTLFSRFADISLRIFDTVSLSNATGYPLILSADTAGNFLDSWNTNTTCSGNFTVEALDLNQTQYQKNTTFLINNSLNRRTQYAPTALTTNFVPPVLANVTTSNNVYQYLLVNRTGTAYIEFTFPVTVLPPTAQNVNFTFAIEQQRQPNGIVINYVVYLVNASGFYDVGCTGGLANGDTFRFCEVTSFVDTFTDQVVIRVNYTTAGATDAWIDQGYLNVSYYGDPPGCYQLGDEPFPPTISAVTASPSMVELNAGSTKSVECNFTITDLNGADDILGANATFYTPPSTGGSAASNVTKYVNSSCDVAASDSTSKSFTCIANFLYYAANGSWTCNATGRSNDGSTNGTGAFDVDTLYALNISPTLVDFGNVPTGNISANRTVNITNLGNQPINISVYGYGAAPADNKAFQCGVGSLDVSLLRFHKNASRTYGQMTNLSSDPQLLNFTEPAQNTSALVINASYWQMQIPQNFNNFGVCNGTVVFQAEAT
jgi:hypothetical protein